MTISFAHDSRHLAETYDRLSDLQFEGGKSLVERLGLGDGIRVLDIGCGTGRLTRWIGERLDSTASVVGIDPLEERIGIARAHGGGTAGFEIGQAEDLGAFCDASMDTVVMASVFHWLSDKAKALAEIRRVLRPGGRVGVTTNPQELSGAGTISRMLRPLLERAPYAGRADLSALTGGTRACTSTDLVLLVLESGLELVELHVTYRASEHASGEAVLDFVEASSFGNFFCIVPEDLRASLRRDLATAFESERGPGGIVVRGWEALLVAKRL
ncbi:MAG: methyltransferase domain-containing protein [Labilithrix sp.]|nr:methyltransferase domain-containing protein [Labilithrix sp.]MCW5816773.1 methyltransferase domain-containing protein [Labilithrix sp.]